MIRKVFALLVSLLIICLAGYANSSKVKSSHWTKNVLLTSTGRRAARTAILIIAPPQIGKSDVELRWQLGKKTWEQYMNSHPNVDCYFIQGSCFNPASSEAAWIEGNTIYVGDIWYEKYRNDRLLHKTVKAMEILLPHYTHFFRTNLNTFFDLKN